MERLLEFFLYGASFVVCVLAVAALLMAVAIWITQWAAATLGFPISTLTAFVTIIAVIIAAYLLFQHRWP